MQYLGDEITQEEAQLCVQCNKFVSDLQAEA